MKIQNNILANRGSWLHHLLFAFFALVLTLPYVSCGGNQSGNDKELKRAVKEMAKVCPLQMSDFMSIENMEYAHNTLTITYGIAAGLMNFDSLRANEAALRKNILIGFANQQNESFRKIIDAVIRARADMKLVLIDGKGASFELVITAEEIKSNRPGTDADPEVLLKSIYDNLKLQIPIDMGNGLTVKDALLDENSFIYIYECDESVIDIDKLNENLSEMKRMILAEFSVDIAAQKLSELIKATNRRLVYKYVGSSSGKTVVVSIGPEEFNLNE